MKTQWKKLEPNEIYSSQGFSQKVVSASWLAFNVFAARGRLLFSADIRVVLKKSSIKRVKYGTIIKCEGIIKSIFENPKAPFSLCRSADIRVVLKKSSIKRVKYGTIIKCEGIIKSIFENPKAPFSLCRCSHGSSRCRQAGIP